MTEISHLRKPAGWKLVQTGQNPISAKFLPAEGASLLIGCPPSGQICTVVWFDKTGKLRMVEKLASKGQYWEGTFRDGRKSYAFTAWKVESANGNPRIAGDIEEGATGKVAAAAAAKWKPGKEFEAEGTWGAEANPGGGGPGTRPG